MTLFLPHVAFLFLCSLAILAQAESLLSSEAIDSISPLTKTKQSLKKSSMKESPEKEQNAQSVKKGIEKKIFKYQEEGSSFELSFFIYFLSFFMVVT